MAPDIGARLQDLREATGWTQAELARKVGRFKADTWRDWEQNKRAPNPGLIEDLAEREGWPLDIFTEGGPMPSTVVNLIVNESAGEGPISDTPAALGAHLEAMQEAAEILADAFSRIAALLEEAQAAARATPPLAAAARILDASEAAEKAQEPPAEDKDAG